jgi:iron complex transport system ATP-binding protein
VNAAEIPLRNVADVDLVRAGLTILSGGVAIHAGPVGDVLTSDRVSEAFAHPVVIQHSMNRWSAQAHPVGSAHLPTWQPDEPSPLHR